jgi:DNA-binding NarL/FixJ family response regulator
MVVNRMPEKISVLLVDDHSLVRQGFRRILEDEPDLTVVGEAGDGREAVRLAQELKPVVIVMDCALPGMSGLVATREILKNTPQQAILMLSMHSEETWVRQALDAGARGYVLKAAVDLELPAAIRKVAAGETVLDPQLSQSGALKGETSGALTPRELEIVQLIVDGKSNKEIADILNLSVHTIAVHRANIMDALGIHKTAELVVYAIRNGLVDIP